MYIKIRVFSIKFVNKYYSNYDELQRTCTLLVFPTMQKIAIISIVLSFPSRYQSLMVDIQFELRTHRHYVTSRAFWLPKLNFHSYLQYVEYLTNNYYCQPALGRNNCTKNSKNIPKISLSAPRNYYQCRLGSFKPVYDRVGPHVRADKVP